MPGVRSLDQQEYYAHPQNAFWPIMQRVIGDLARVDYTERLNLLLSKHIGLWDVLASCERQGSLDSSIRVDTEIVNDFESLFDRCPSIRAVLFNGAKARQVFFKHYDSQMLADRSIQWHIMPSTSPAHARMSKQQKIHEWRSVIEQYLIN